VIELKVSRPIDNIILEEIFKKHMDKIHFVKGYMTETAKAMTIIGEKLSSNSKKSLTFMLSSFYDRSSEEIFFGRPDSDVSILDIWAGASEEIEEELFKDIQKISTSIGGIVFRKKGIET
jgi:hypothetical protein